MCFGSQCCGLQKKCALMPECRCPCHTFDMMHPSEIIGLCSHADHQFDIDATIGMTRTQLFDHLQSMSHASRDLLVALGEPYADRIMSRGVDSSTKVVGKHVRNFIIPLDKSQIEKAKESCRKTKRRDMVSVQDQCKNARRCEDQVMKIIKASKIKAIKKAIEKDRRKGAPPKARK